MQSRLPPILTASDFPADERWPRQLSRLVKRGTLIRIRRGCYVEAARWTGLDASELYRMRLNAICRTARSDPLFGDETAGFLWGFPRRETPAEVRVIMPEPTGRRSGNGVHRIARTHAGVITARLEGMLVTGKIQTAVDLAVRYDFPWAVAVMDRLLNVKPLPAEHRRQPVAKAEVQACIQQLPSVRHRNRATAVLTFADGFAMYPGESLSRVHLVRRGFVQPVLQHRVIDAHGHAATVDFYWKDAGVVGEFDGRTKYMKPEYLRGRTPSEVVVEEKAREDRIRATGLHVVRWLWETAVSPVALERCLIQAGVPRRNVTVSSGDVSNPVRR